MLLSVILVTFFGLQTKSFENFASDANDKIIIDLNSNDLFKIEQIEKEKGNLVILPNNLKIKKDEINRVYTKVENPEPTKQLIFEGGEVRDYESKNNSFTVKITPSNTKKIKIETVPINLEPSEIQGIPIDIISDENIYKGNYFITFELKITNNIFTETISL